MEAAVVAGVNESPVLHFAEHILDAMALSIEGAVLRYRDFAIGF